MNLNTRLRKLERAALAPPGMKDPAAMTHEELDAEIERIDEELRHYPGEAEGLARIEAMSREQGEEAATQVRIERLERELAEDRKLTYP